MTVIDLPLRPDLAVVGMEIRVIGNDATAKLSISAGTMSRLNRNTPNYTTGYNDSNTNYLQGSAMTSGGSSGSPVIDIEGNAVALNAGSYSNASVALFLPLEQPLKALGHLQKNEPIPRGTLQARWNLHPFHECERLGLASCWVEKVQKEDPEETCMLVTKTVLPDGPADSKIEEGDVLLKVNDRIITHFKHLTAVLDSNIGKQVKVLVHRGTEEVEVEMTVDDLEDITPKEYLITAGSILHDFSYIIALQYRVAVRNAGVYLCTAAGSFNLNASGPILIQSVDGNSTPNLKAFSKAIETIQGSWLPLRTRLDLI